MIARWNLIPLPPDDQEGLGYRVFYGIRSCPAPTVGVDVTIETVVDFAKAIISVGQFKSSAATSHFYMSGQADSSADISRNDAADHPGNGVQLRADQLLPP